LSNRNRRNRKNKITIKETAIWILLNAVLMIPVFLILGTIMGNFENTQIADTSIYFHTQGYLVALVMLIIGIFNVGVYKILKIKELK